MGQETLIQSIMSTSYGAMGFYLAVGVLVLVAGWVADSAIGSRPNA